MLVFRLHALTFGLVCLATLGCDSGGRENVQNITVVSPGGELELAVATDDAGQLTYTVTKNGEPVIETSPMGLVSTTHDLSIGVTMSSGSSRTVDESYTMVTGKRSTRRVLGSEIAVPLRDANGARAELILRAHDDGIAFRYHLLGDGESQVMSESTGFAIPSGARVVTRAYDGGDLVFTPTAGEYQQPPIVLPLGEAIDRSGFAFPTMFELGSESLYAVLSEADLGASYCATRLNEEPQGNLYEIRFPDEREAQGVGEVLPKSTLPFLTPWRAVMIGDLATVVQSTLIDDLSTPSSLEDESWIAPGRAAWSWFSQDTGTPELQSEYIDFAGEHGWDYVLVDAKWDQWENAEQEVRDLVAQAASVGVKVLLWYNSSGPQNISPLETPLNRMIDSTRRAEMEKISAWGVAGVKVDFFNSDKQDRINQYLGILRDAADYELLVNFHGSTVPRGWQRTYPHLMTQEAVNGAEVYRLATVQGAPDAITNVRHALLRNIVGSMDYTPIVFEAALSVVGLPYAHSLALAVVFESGIQHFADQADADPDAGYRAVFAAYPYVGDFMSIVPVTWDDTRLVRGSIDDHVILARRKGVDWYLGGIHAVDSSVEYTFSLDFLDQETTYEMTLIEQGENETAFERSTVPVGPGDPLAITLPANGGFVARLVAQ
jgi:alpha-glucosidase